MARVWGAQRSRVPSLECGRPGGRWSAAPGAFQRPTPKRDSAVVPQPQRRCRMCRGARRRSVGQHRPSPPAHGGVGCVVTTPPLMRAQEHSAQAH